MIKNLNFDNEDFAYEIFGESVYKNKILEINNIIIPNFYMDHCNNILLKSTMFYELNHLIYKIFLSNDYLTFYETHNFKINKDDIVFDCGGNMGLFSAAIANRCKTVYAFEPMSLIRKNLYKTAALYHNINVIPYGLYSKNCEKFIMQKDNPGASTVSNQYNIYNKTLYKERCKLITIDSFIKQTNIIPNFIKVDIEGSEYDLLKGAQECIKKYSPKISIALHDYDEDKIGQIKALLPYYNVNIIDNWHGKLLLGAKDENKFIE